MSILQRFSGIGQILKFLMSLKAEDISRAIALGQDLANTDLDLKARVLAALELADIVTDYTPDERDDELVEYLERLAEEDLIWDLVHMVSDLLDGEGAKHLAGLMASDGEGLRPQEDPEASAIPWAIVIQVASLIVRIILEFTAKKEDA